MLSGHNQQHVIDVIKGKEPKQEKTALIVEGGGMRGVLSAGSLLAIDLMGYGNAFDEVYASSAGAVNVAYILSKQGELGIRIYFEDICNSRFINPLRLHKIVDVDYVYDQVITHVKPLDIEAVRNARTNFFVTLTHAESGRPVFKSVKDPSIPLIQLLKASSALPILYNKVVKIGGVSYFDGGLAKTVPILNAIENGCKNILVLLTNPVEYESKQPNPFLAALFYLMCGRGRTGLRKLFLNGHHDRNNCRGMAVGRVNLPTGISVAAICPDPEEYVVTRTTKNADLLVRSACSMGEKTCRYFGCDPSLVKKALAYSLARASQNP